MEHNLFASTNKELDKKKEAMKEIVVKKIKMCGSENRA